MNNITKKIKIFSSIFLALTLFTAIITACSSPSDSGGAKMENYFVAVSKTYITTNHLGGEHIEPGQVAYSRDGIKWDISMELSKGMSLGVVCYGDGKFVALPEGETNNQIAYSANGVDWEWQDMPVKATWTSVCFGEGTFVAVGCIIDGVAKGKVVYSNDGIKWQEVQIDDGDWESVCYGKDGIFVAVSAGYKSAAYSTDKGKSWTNVTTGEWGYSVCYGNNKFIAMTKRSEIGLYSSDYGKSWTVDATLLPCCSGGPYWRVCYGNGMFVAVAENNGSIAFSTEGDKNWDTKAIEAVVGGDAARDWQSVCYGDGTFVAVSAVNADPIAMYSTNGIDWKTTPIEKAHWKSVCYGKADTNKLQLFASSKKKSNSLIASVMQWVNDKIVF